jgi:hypothetical protein
VVAPAQTDVLPGETLTCVAGAVIVTIAALEALASATLVATTVTVAGLGTVAGAVKSPVELMVPSVELPPATPFTVHRTEVLLVPLTPAINCRIAPVEIDEAAGETLTSTFPAGAVIARMAEPDGLVSAELVALMVTVEGLGTVAGAVYNPAALIMPKAALPPRMLFTDQVRVVLVGLTTVAVNCNTPPAGSDAVAGETVITGKAISVTVVPVEPQLARNIAPAITVNRVASLAEEPF